MDKTQVAAFYRQPKIQKFITDFVANVNAQGGNAQAGLGSLAQLSAYYTAHGGQWPEGLTDDDIRFMVQAQSAGFAYDPQTDSVTEESGWSKAGKFVLGYVMPAVAGYEAAGGLFSGGSDPVPAGADAGADVSTGLPGSAGFAPGDITDASQLAGDIAPAADAGLPGSPGYAPGDISDASQLTSGGSVLPDGGGGGATSWLGKNALGLTDVAGKLASTAIQAVAQGRATAAQTKLAEEALQYEKSLDAYKGTTEANRYAALTAAKSPYVAEGSAAANRFGSLLGLTPGAGPTPPPTYAPAPMPGLTGASALPQPAAAPAAPTNTVMLRSPDGSSTKAVPASELQHWLSLGATQVSA